MFVLVLSVTAGISLLLELALELRLVGGRPRGATEAVQQLGWDREDDDATGDDGGVRAGRKSTEAGRWGQPQDDGRQGREDADGRDHREPGDPDRTLHVRLRATEPDRGG